MLTTCKSLVHSKCLVTLRKFRKAGKSNSYVSIKRCFVVLKKHDATVLTVNSTLPPSVKNCRVLVKHFREFDSFGSYHSYAAVRKCAVFLRKEDCGLYPHRLTLQSRIKLSECRVDIRKLPFESEYCHHDSTERSLRDRNPRTNPKMTKMSILSTAVNSKLFQSQVPLIGDSAIKKNRSRRKELDCCGEPVSYTSYPLGRLSSILKDDEDTPRNVIPFWAQDEQLKNNNNLKEVDVDFVFAPCESPDLDAIFLASKMSRRNIWQSPFKIKKKQEHFRRSTKVNVEFD